MSHSVFKEFPATNNNTTTTSGNPFGGGGGTPAISPNDATCGSRDNVVIVLNKDGSVSVDQHALHSFLLDEAGRTAVSVVRVQSPTPSLQEELRELGPSSDEDDSSNGEHRSNNSSDRSDDNDSEESEDEANSDDEDDQEVGSESPESDSEREEGNRGRARGGQQKSKAAGQKGGKGGRGKRKRAKEQVPHVRLTVEQFLPPEQAKIFAAEILQHAGMTSGLTLDVDYDYQRFVVRNDHCYTPLTSPSQRDGGSGVGTTTSAAETTVSAPITKSGNRRARTAIVEKLTPVTSGRGRANKSAVEETAAAGQEDTDSENGEDIPDAGEEVDLSDEDYSVSSESDENDRDSDLDFRVNSNYLPKKKKKKVQKGQNSSNSGAAGGRLGRGGGDSNSANHSAGGGGAPVTKGNTHSSVGGGGQQQQGPGSSLLRKQRQSLVSSSSSSGGVGVRKSAAAEREDHRAHLVQSKLQFKSSPGSATTVTKVATGAAVHLGQLQRQKARTNSTVVGGSTTTTPVSTTTTPLAATHQTPRRGDPKGLIGGGVKQDPLFTDMSSLFSTPDIIKKVGGAGDSRSNISNRKEDVLQLPAAFELDLINSIVSGDDMETRKSSAAAIAAANATNSTDDNLDLGDASSLLDGIVGEDGLPEELLQHVAELVENKSLQEVIDKQVLGVEDPMAHLTNLLPKATPLVPQTPPQLAVQQQQPKKESPFVKLAQQKQLAKQSAAAAASLTAPRKEPIKIVRSDGRVITLPPIEAPTTRGAKRRAQNSMDGGTATPTTTPGRNLSTDSSGGGGGPNSTGDSSHMVEILSVSLLPETAAPVSARKKSGSDRGSTSRRASTTPSVADSDMDMEFSSEDDPNRLWCICKTPHNNRFMICCDTCEDWFHGKCVNITKAMGQQMEAAGKEWTCPNCVLGLTGTEQVCMVCRHKPAKPDSVYCSDECIVKHANRTQQQQQPTVVVSGGPQPPNASPQIGRQAPGVNANAPRIVTGKGATDPPSEGKVRIGLLKNAQGRVIVYHKKTMQCLSGDNAPFLANIKEWLAQNPDYAIVAPGSEVAEAFKRKQAQLQQIKVRALQKQASLEQQQQQEKIQSKLKFGANKQVVIVHPKTAQQIKVEPSGKSSPVTERTHSMKAPRKTAPEAATTTTAHLSSPMGDKKVQRGEVEPIRLTVRKTLKEHLAQRMSEVKEGSARLTTEEIEQFALETEQEMFALFNRDTGNKYKAKYRSLAFNVKDRKNETLFQKICEKAVKPYRLVRMSPEELASQELAKWRENENKHQLEMIKKSEMDLLAQAKSYVLKSHKGEEVLEDMINENQIQTVDDVTMLSGQVKGGGEMELDDEEGEDSQGGGSTDGTRSNKVGSSGGHDSRNKDKKRDRSRDRDRDKHRSHHSSSSSSSKHKRKRSRERSRERDKDRAKEKGTSSSSKHKSSSSSAHHSSSSHHHHHSGSTGTAGSGSANKEKGSTTSSSVKKESSSSSSRHKDKVQSIKEESNHSSSPASTASSTNNKSSSGETSHVYKPSKKEAEESYDLIEKILQGTSPELVAKLHEMEKQKSMDVKEEEETEENASGTENAQDVKLEQETADDEEYNPESANPLAAESPPPIVYPREIWSGKVVYQDNVQFLAALLPLYGDSSDIVADFPSVFEVQGRIGPDVVWDYLGKIKRSVNRDITVVRFVPRSAKEHAAYETMYSYFETKNRLGVLKPKSEIIKDFYLVPQKKGRLLPSVLLTLKGLGSYETKANCIVGIVVKATMKRPSSSLAGGSANKILKKTAVTMVAEQHNTPPGSPKVGHKLTVGLPQVGLGLGVMPTKTDDDDEPYSPGGSEEDADDSAMDTLPAPPPPPKVVPYELQKEVERLNRQIEEQKNEIVEMLAKDPLEEEPYSPSRPMSPSSSNKDKVPTIPLANISIPSNLHEILASLKNVGGSSSGPSLGNKMEEDEEEEYNPLPVSASAKMSTETYKPRPTSPSTRAFLLAQQEQQAQEEIPFLSVSGDNNIGPSKLSHMTDAELMSLVPDGMDLGPPQRHASNAQPMPPGLGDDDEEYDPSQ